MFFRAGVSGEGPSPEFDVNWGLFIHELIFLGEEEKEWICISHLDPNVQLI